jgi:DNA-directed RNA polymerase alpha subunit
VFVDLLECHIAQLKEEGARQQQATEQRTRKLSDLRGEHDRLTEKIKALEAQQERKRQKLNDLQTECERRTAEIAGLKGAQEEHEDAVADQRRLINELQEQARALEERIAQYQSSITELENRREYLQTDIHQQKQILQELETAEVEQKAAVEEQERRVDHLQGQIAQMEREIESLQHEIDHRNETAKTLEATNSKMADNIAQKEERVSALQTRLEELKDKAEKRKTHVSRLEREASELERQIEQRESNLAETETVEAEASETAIKREQADQSQIETAEVIDGDPPIDVLGLSVRPYNALRRAGFETVGQMAQMSQEQIEDIHNIGSKSADEIQGQLEEYLSAHSLLEQLSSFCPPPEELMSRSADLFGISIDELDLSERARQALLREDIMTIGWVAYAMRKRLISDRALVRAVRFEIEDKLDNYLDACGLLNLDDSESSQPLVEQSLLGKAVQAPLDDISVERLALTRRQASRLQQLDIESIGELARQSVEAVSVKSDFPSTVERDVESIQKQLHLYLEWLAEQDEDIWSAEVTEQDISPIYHLLLAGTSLEEMSNRWLSILSKRECQVLQWRYGYDGEPLTLAEMGNQLDISRERVRQLQAQSLRTLSSNWLDSPLRFLIAPLRHVLVEEGGLMRKNDIERTIADLAQVGDTDIEWISQLILHTVDAFEEVTDSLWGISDYPLHLIPKINRGMAGILGLAGVPRSSTRVVRDFKVTRLYQDHQDTIDDRFLIACLRENEDTVLVDGQYALDKWKREQTGRSALDSSPADESDDPDTGETDYDDKTPSIEEKPTKPQWRSRRKGHRLDLAEWEEYLQPWVQWVELLGEIPISSEERSHLGRVLGSFIESRSRGCVFRELRYDYPCSFAVFLTAQGIYGYDGRSGYWPGVGEVIDKSLNPNWTLEFGQLFEKVIETFDLPLFPDMGGRRYVDLILAHGGIPDYSLPDFFEHLLQPAVTQFRYADMSAAELIEEWLWHPDRRTDKPVLRFLEFGGKVAQDFVARCREMAWSYLDEGVVPEAEAIGLPERVVEAYRDWIVKQGTEATQHQTQERWRLRKPRLMVDPWGEGVVLDLPPQQVPTTEIQADVRWRVTADEETYAPIYVPIRRLGFDLKTEADSIVLREPAKTYRVSLEVDGSVKRTWTYQGVDDEQHLLIFDPERFRLISWQHSLPAQRLGVLYPARFALEIDGKSKMLEELPRMPWGWADFRGAIYDLSRSTQLTLREDADTVLALPVRAEKTDRPPQLMSGDILSPEVPDVRAPVYVGSPPDLRIPLTGRRAADEELSRWQVTVRNKWAAAPQRDTSVRLAMLRSQIAIEEDAIDLPLSLPVLLGEAPFGNFDVRVRGPLGYDADLTLRIVPHLATQGHDSLYLPDPKNGPQPVTLSAEVPARDRIAYQERKGACTIQLTEEEGDRRQYAIEVGPEATEIELTVERSLPSGETARVPFSTTVRRLRWALLDDQTPTNRKGWTGETIKRSFEALLQSESAYLLVALPQSAGEEITPTLRLLDIDGNQLQVMEAAPPRSGRDIWRFDLSGFLDTIRTSRQSSILRFELNLWNLPDQEGSVSLTALSLTQKLLVEDIMLEARRDGDRTILNLSWHESAPLRHRRVRLWSVWRPWLGPLERSVPDEANSSQTIILDEGSSFQNPGKLRIEFVVVDPWAPPATPQRPLAGASATADIEVMALHKRIKFLTDQIEERRARFVSRLERAFIYAEIEAVEASTKDQMWCFHHLNRGTLPQILALIDLVRRSGDQDRLEELRRKMFAPDRVERLLHRWSQEEISAEHFHRYLDNAPQSTLLHKVTCRYLLSVEDEPVRLRAAEDLIRHTDKQGLEAVLTWVDAGTLSDGDAIALLKATPDFSMAYLEDRTENPVALRLLETLAFELDEQAPVVRPGTWVYTDAGWGRIERIETIDGQPVEEFMAKEDDYRLYVTLRPTLDAEPILVDLARHLITFAAADEIHTCAKCKGFSSQDQNLIVERHDWVVHGGIGPKHLKEQMTKRSLRTLTYSARPPRKAGLGLPEDIR